MTHAHLLPLPARDSYGKEFFLVSRDLDLDDLDSLSDDDLRWVRDRGLLTTSQEMEYLSEDVAMVMGEAASSDLRPGGPSIPNPDVPHTASDHDLDRMSKTALQNEARLRGISQSGNTATLLQRIKDHDSGVDEEDEED